MKKLILIAFIFILFTNEGKLSVRQSELIYQSETVRIYHIGITQEVTDITASEFTILTELKEREAAYIKWKYWENHKKPKTKIDYNIQW